ncbi:MAG: hypothetical protein Q7R45_01230 [Sulfuricaulis sp.]|nr:hypothetical protein [Sulfuricaulis sp.]
MSNINKVVAAAVISALIFGSSQAAGQAESGGNALTIYSTAQPGAISPELYRNGGRGQAIPGYAVVRQQRDIDLTRGRNNVRFSDVAAYIDPTTVMFESLTDPTGTSVVEQNFQFDLVNHEKLLRKYIDQTIKVDQVRGNSVETFSGTLLSTSGGMILKRDDGSVQLLPHNSAVTLPSLPGGLITRPTLVWDINTQRAGSHRARVSYQTTGITWWTDYNLTYSEGASANACKLDVGAWVSIINQSGASYPEAKLKLIAGDVQRAQPAGRVNAPRAAAMMMAREEKDGGFAEKEFFEYHLYTLGRPTTLPDNSTKQIELFPAARNVPCEKSLVYYGLMPGYHGYGGSPITDRNYGVQSNKKVDVYLGFRNSQDHHMGMPLPSGRIRVSKMDDADKTLEFIGENVIDHTPKNEKVLIKLGSAFDVVGERRQVDFKVDTSRKTMSEDIEVKLRNQKKEPVTVIVKANLYRWVNWQLTSKSHDFEKQDARTIHFPLKIAAGGEVTLRYSVQYTW